MQFIKIDEVPESKRCRPHCYSLKTKIDKFMSMDIPCAKVEYDSDEYTSTNACLNSLQSFCSRNRIPAYAMMRNGEVYIIRTDKIFRGDSDA